MGLAADTIIPEPGNPQALNRYSYVLNNPLKYTDPTGHAACATDDQACWENEWYWKNRWYNAHGYFHDGNHWGRPDNAVFSDEGILREVLAEAGIAASGSWNWQTELSLVAQGVVAMMQKVGGDQGIDIAMAQMRKLLPYGVDFRRGTEGWGTCAGMGACALYSTIWFFDSIFANNHPADWIRTNTVHELAHIIDHQHFAAGGGFHHSSFPGKNHLTNYGTTNRWEYWAEAVTIWVYGDRYLGTGAVYQEPSRGDLSSLQVSYLDEQLGVNR